MSVSSRFDAFVTNIQLTRAQLQEAQRKHAGVRLCLANCYYSSHSTSHSILVGSYGKNTACRPPTDLDILFVMPSFLWTHYRLCPGNGPSKLLQDVKAVLQATYPNTTMRGDGQVVVVSFTGSFGVEVLPVFPKQYYEGCYYYPDTHNGGSWKETDPQAQKDFISTSNQASNNNTVHLIKMMKVWKYHCGVPISSFAIELTAVPFLSQWPYSGKTSVYYDYMVRDYLSYLLTRVGGWELIPGVAEVYNLENAWESKAKSAHKRAVKACEYEIDADKDKVMEFLAIEEWKKIFGGFYTGQY